MRLELNAVNKIFVHCSATSPDQDIGRDEIDKWHRNRGWSGIGYHFVIRRNGDIEVGRPLDKVGAHVKGYNRVSWGICMVGGVDNNGHARNNFTKAQFVSLRIVLDGLKKKRPRAVVLGHRDASPDIDGDGVIEEWEWLKRCPCFDAGAWYASD